MTWAKFFTIVTVIGLFLSPVHAATSGDASPSANVAQLINIEVADAGNNLGDIRLTDINDIHIITMTVDNNDDDGFTLTYTSDNGVTYGVDNNFGYLIHASAAENTAVTPNSGQKPATRYKLLMGEDSSNSVEYGHTARPTGLVADCVSGGEGKFEITDTDGSDVVFNAVDRATRTGVFKLCITQTADIQLFHGDFIDTITVSIADN